MMRQLATRSSQRLKNPAKMNEIIGICNHVMNTLGVGHTEDVYHRAVSEGLNAMNLPHTCECYCPIMYLGKCVGMGRADIVVDNFVIEIKAIQQLNNRASDQLCKYMTAIQLQRASDPNRLERSKFFDVSALDLVGILVNFNQKNGTVESIVLNSK
jgi:GxxExxY protein